MQAVSGRRSVTNQSRLLIQTSWLCAAIATAFLLAGCSHRRISSPNFADLKCAPCQTMLQQVDYTKPTLDTCDDASDVLSGVPLTLSNFNEQQPLEMTVEECVEYALANSKVLQKLGGAVVNSPGTTRTLYDQALNETNPAFPASVEAALAAFDAQLNSSLFFTHNERKFNNPLFGGGASAQVSDLASARLEISKQTAAGTQLAVRNLTDYTSNNNPISTPTSPFGNRFPSVYDVVNQVEIRQPLLRGFGTAVNRIAGPNAVAGQYNGVLVARIRSDISLVDFEIAVRNLVRDVESNYWELYFAYQDLDTKIAARDSTREIWENRKLRYDSGIGRPDEEAQARQQYFNFQLQAQNALTGVLNGQPGVLGAERNLRRLMGFPASDGTLIKPISEPAIAPVVFDWDQSQMQALERRSELRRQKWVVRQRELEMCAAKALNKWRFDLVGQYDWRGFGDDLFGSAGVPEGSAYQDLMNGDLNDWQVGVEFGGAIGKRQGYLAVRNAELNLVREKSLLKEQQRQIVMDLNAAYTEVDRALQNVRTTFNSRIAVEEELEPKRKRVVGGQDPVFFLLEAEQRVATAESATHRAVADYNLALLNFSFVAGEMLSRYNIALTEDQWSADAQANAAEKADRYQPGGLSSGTDVGPVTAGPYDQTANVPAVTTTVMSTTSEPAPAQPVDFAEPEAKVDSLELDAALPSSNDSTSTEAPPADPPSSRALSAVRSYFKRPR